VVEFKNRVLKVGRTCDPITRMGDYEFQALVHNNPVKYKHVTDPFVRVVEAEIDLIELVGRRYPLFAGTEWFRLPAGSGHGFRQCVSYADMLAVRYCKAGENRITCLECDAKTKALGLCKKHYNERYGKMRRTQLGLRN
jgi:hypothetical protein